MSSITPVGVARKNYLIKFFFPYHRLFSIAADVFYYKLVVHAALEALGSEDATDVAFRLHEILETPLIPGKCTVQISGLATFLLMMVE